MLHRQDSTVRAVERENKEEWQYEIECIKERWPEFGPAHEARLRAILVPRTFGSAARYTYLTVGGAWAHTISELQDHCQQEHQQQQQRPIGNNNNTGAQSPPVSHSLQKQASLPRRQQSSIDAQQLPFHQQLARQQSLGQMTTRSDRIPKQGQSLMPPPQTSVGATTPQLEASRRHVQPVLQQQRPNHTQPTHLTQGRQVVQQKQPMRQVAVVATTGASNLPAAAAGVARAASQPRSAGGRVEKGQFTDVRHGDAAWAEMMKTIKKQWGGAGLTTSDAARLQLNLEIVRIKLRLTGPNAGTFRL